MTIVLLGWDEITNQQWLVPPMKRYQDLSDLVANLIIRGFDE